MERKTLADDKAYEFAHNYWELMNPIALDTLKSILKIPPFYELVPSKENKEAWKMIEEEKRRRTQRALDLARTKAIKKIEKAARLLREAVDEIIPPSQ